MTYIQKNKFEIFYSELIRVNKFINLTSITDRNEVEIKHFNDSLSAIEVIKKINQQLCTMHYALSTEIIDIGTGAGFPSIPLAIMLPDINFTLIETVGKKVNFLLDIKEKLRLENIEIIKSRVEDLNKDKKYDVCVSRAVASLPTLLEYCLPFTKLDGHLIVYKGNNYIEELENSKKALVELGGEIIDIKHYNLKLGEEIIERVLIIVKKITETPNKYPRGSNKPRLKPL